MSDSGLSLPVDFGWPGEGPSQWETMLPLYGPGFLQRLLGIFQGDPIADEQFTALNALKRLSPPSLANSCVLTVDVGSIRLRFGQGDVTAILGHLLVAGTMLSLTGSVTMHSVSMLETVVGSVVMVTYFS